MLSETYTGPFMDSLSTINVLWFCGPSKYTMLIASLAELQSYCKVCQLNRYHNYTHSLQNRQIKSSTRSWGSYQTSTVEFILKHVRDLHKSICCFSVIQLRLIYWVSQNPKHNSKYTCGTVLSLQ